MGNYERLWQGNNPARWRGHLENLLPAKAKVRTVKHHRALAYVEMLEFLAKVRQLREEHPGDVTAAALTFALLTGARTSEVLKAEWEEFAEPGIWRVPAERMKARQEWRCAISDAAQAVLDDMRKLRTGRYVFPGEHIGDSHRSPDVMMRLINKLGYGDRMTTHGLRSSLTDWCAEQTDLPACRIKPTIQSPPKKNGRTVTLQRSRAEGSAGSRAASAAP